MSLLRRIVDSYMQKVFGIDEHCNRCLRTERWGGSVVLMVVDAAFTSIGLNHLWRRELASHNRSNTQNNFTCFC